MANTTVNAGNVVKQWESKFFAEYVRENLFAPYMGSDEYSAIQMNENLTKNKGDVVSIPLVKALAGSGVSGNTALEGNEDLLGNFAHDIRVDLLRNGVVVQEMEVQRTVIDMLEAARTMLKFWAMDKLRDAVIEALMTPALDNTNYFLATEAQKDAWLAANSDRVLFGSVKSNSSSLDHSTSLANVDNTNDKLSAGVVSLAKRMAKSPTNGAIRPIRINASEEWFVMFAPSQSFRDLKADATINQANREAWTRGADNPLFTDGDLLYDGVIIREIPEIPIIPGVGAGAIDVAANFLVGAQAIGVAWAQRTTSRTDTRDYGNRNGVAIQEIRGVNKMFYNNIQHGMVTVYTAGVADT